jgi:colanic acid biosynthesis glycosyl transferase WcaI
MARILIYSLVFPPDGVSTAQLMGEIAEDLVAGGHHLTVVTTFPHYHRDRAAEEAQPLRPLRFGWLCESRYRGIQVFHTVAQGGRSSLWGRIRSWLSFHIIGFVAGLRLVPRPDVILVPSPLLTAGFVAWVLTLIRGGRYIYNVQELYPDLAVEMGRLRNPMVVKILHRLERFVYNRAGAVTGISSEICDRVSERSSTRTVVRYVPNFVDLSQLAPSSRNNSFAREWGLNNSFVVSYAGNLGHAQGLESVLQAADLCTDERIKFVFVGSGALERTVKRHEGESRTGNVLHISHQPYAIMPELYGASDVCLVPLMGGVGGSALPSKVLRIMACGRPVVAVCEPTSELARLVSSADAGVVVPPDQPDVLLQAILELAADQMRCSALGRSGRLFVERHYARDVVTGQYLRLIEELTNESG